MRQTMDDHVKQVFEREVAEPSIGSARSNFRLSESVGRIT